MNGSIIEHRFRVFLLVVTVFVLVLTLVELVLEEHTEEALQWIPFFLCGAGLVTVVGALVRPERATLLALRFVMLLVALGGALGIALHLVNNFAFELEIRASAAPADVVVEALKGANPLFAPGILIFAALLALAATYAHPALEQAQKN